MNSPKKILFSANDPGGANAIVPVVVMLRDQGYEIQGFLTGPARDIFSQKKIDTVDASSVSSDSLRREVEKFGPELFLAGTSFGDSIDKKIFKILKGVPSVYVIDFWSHYGHRFSAPEADPSHLPTRICVIDERMRDEMLQEGFPHDQLMITGNPHFDHFAEGITRDHENAACVVFISQPIKSDAAEKGASDRDFDEYTILESIIRTLPSALQLSIRLHPREDTHKYDAYLSDRVKIASEDTLEEALSKAGLVIGMFSPVLMQAAFAGKPTISYQIGDLEKDPLPTSAVGITKRVSSDVELAECFAMYERGESLNVPGVVKNMFPKDATKRVVQELQNLLNDTGSVL